MSKLTNQQKDVLAYTGTFGAMLSATCLIQHMIITRDHWVAHLLTAIYLFSILVFVLLALKKSIAPLLLIVSAALVLLAELILLINLVFSAVVLVLFIYSATIVAYTYIEQLPKKLKEQAMAKRMEEDAWRGKI